MTNINNFGIQSANQVAQWAEAEISRSAKINRLDLLPLLEQVAKLQEMGYQYRVYPDGSHHWGRISPLLNEWFDISVFRIEVTP
jgi:hypothetical protein